MSSRAEIASWLGTSEEAGGHPAVRAWLRVEPRAPRVGSIEILKPPHRNKNKRKSSVLRLEGLGPGGSAVVAKLCRDVTAAHESRIYREILPQLSIAALEFYGCTPSDEPGMSWFFVEDAGEERYSWSDPGHREQAARWMAELHVRSRELPALAQLPDRGPRHYRSHLELARHRIEEVLGSGHRTPADLAVLQRLQDVLASLRADWMRLERLCEALPTTLAHGDLVEKNARLRSEGSGRRFLVFDWGTAGRGQPAADLAAARLEGPELATYLGCVKAAWPELDSEGVTRMARIGRILRRVAAVEWASRSLVQASHVIPTLRKYLADLERELRVPVWRGP